MASQQQIMKRRFELLTTRSESVDIKMAIAATPAIEVRDDIIAMHKRYRGVVPRSLNQIPTIEGLSPRIGMGMTPGLSQTNKVVEAPAIHIDEEFLNESAKDLDISKQSTVARYFIMSAAAHSYTYNAPPVQKEFKKNGNNKFEAMRRAWQWAGAIALETPELSRSAHFIRDHVGQAASIIQLDRLERDCRPLPWLGIGSPAKPENWHDTES
jgi:hypothetical protein